MKYLSTQTGLRPAHPSAFPSGQSARWVAWLLVVLLTALTAQVRAQTIPSSITVTGACLNGTYTLSKVADDFESTGRPAYSGTGDVTINSTAYTDVNIIMYYVPTGSSWVLAFDGQPYQSNASTASLPPATGWQAVPQNDGTIGVCEGSGPFRVLYATTVSSITRAGSSPTNATSVNYTVTFAADVTGLTASNFALDARGGISGATIGTITGSGRTYTVPVNTGSGSGTLQLILANTQNLSPNVSNVPFVGDTYTIDKTAPVVSNVTAPANGTYLSGQTLSFVVNFSEAVTVTGTPQVVVVIGSTNRTANYTSGSGSTALAFNYTLQNGDLDTDGVTLGASLLLNGGTLRDAVGNNATLTLNGIPNTTGVLVDAVAPTVVSITRERPTGPTTNASSVSFFVTFSESVTGITGNSFVVTNPTGAVTGTIDVIATMINGSNKAASVTVSGISGNGTLRLDVKSSGSGIADLAGNPLSGGFTTGETYTIDQTRPSVVITTSPAVNGGFLSGAYPIAVTVTFSESVTDFVASDLNVTNGDVRNFSGNGSTYTFSLFPYAKGQTQIQLAANVAQDAAGNGNTAASPVSFFYLPPVTITGFAPTPTVACAGTPVTLTATLGVLTDTYSFTLMEGDNIVIGNTPNAFRQTVVVRGSGNVTFSLRVFNGYTYAFASTTVTVNPAPTVSLANNGPITCTKPTVTLTATGNGQGESLTYRFSAGATQMSGASSNTATVSSAGDYSVTVTTANSCTATAQTTVGNSATLPTPTLLTQSGQSATTVDLNAPPVTLFVGGCSGTASWTGSNGTSGTGSTITVPTTQPGRFVYRTTCQVGTCVSDPASATVTVTGRLTVLLRDVDNYADNNAIQPLLQVLNQGAGALPLSGLTLRYYLTVEGASALSNLSVNYAQVGNQNVRLRYVPLTPAQTGAGGYVEVGFAEAAGTLAAGGNSGNIQLYFAKGDYSALNELDDYSYATVRDQLVSTLRVTAYYNGVLIAGIEPGNTGGGTTPPATVQALRALTESKNGPSATQINTFLEIRNEGTTAVNYSDLKARYYFTADGNERLQVEVDEGAVSARLVKLPQAVNGADTYLELTFNQGGQLAAGGSTGRIRYRISKPDGGRFDQTNDWSYQEQPQQSSQNTHLVVLVGNQVAWGMLPAGASARVAAIAEPGTELNVRVIGNPLTDDQVRVEVTGAQGQPLRLQVSDLTGRSVNSRQVEQASALESHSLNVSQSAAGVLLLQVSTPTQSRTVKVLRAQ